MLRNTFSYYLETILYTDVDIIKCMQMNRIGPYNYRKLPSIQSLSPLACCGVRIGKLVHVKIKSLITRRGPYKSKTIIPFATEGYALISATIWTESPLSFNNQLRKLVMHKKIYLVGKLCRGNENSQFKIESCGTKLQNRPLYNYHIS